MTKHTRVRRNDACPCESGHKYKKCCQGQVDWEALLKEPISSQLRYVSLRGRNLLFINRMADLLQLDSMGAGTNFADLKRAFTPKVVRQIYEAIPEIWPDREDNERALTHQRHEVTALYSGTYEPEAIFRALTRHCLYTDKILLPDPFMYPLSINDEYSPLLHPEKHRCSTVKWAFLWFTLFPWIESGLVNFIRTPGDFDPTEYHEIIDIQREKLEANPELKEALERSSDEMVGNPHTFDGGLWEWFTLSHPDEYWLDMHRRFPESRLFESEHELLRFLEHRRDAHPYYVQPLKGQSGEIMHESTGASYEASKRICALTNSHIITDISYRWKEIEFDHKFATGQTAAWSPFAKALQSVDMKVLNEIPVQSAFQLRSEDRLEQMRHFFNRVWRACRDPDLFADANVGNLAAELDERVREAEVEWEKIDKQLMKWLGATTGTLLSTGVVGFTAAAAAGALTGTTGLVLAQWQRKSFRNKFPAGFFLGAKR